MQRGQASKRPRRSENNDLPISCCRDQILKSVQEHKTTVIVGETGSGKTTQIPQYLIDAGIASSVLCTQPRRIATITVAQRVADERFMKVGDEVGYVIRFENVSGSRTRIKYVTDGVLIREMTSNAKLPNYDVVIIDEAHERSLQTDIAMGLLRRLQNERDDIRIIVMSATLQVDLFREFFMDSNVVVVPGRQFPVDIYYLKEAEQDFVEAAMLACLQVHAVEAEGDVLVFLPGQDEIEALQNLLEQNLPRIVPNYIERQISTEALEKSKDRRGLHDDYIIRPLYASMPAEDQKKAFQKTIGRARKFILATNIAETSVTITGVKYVIDTGYVKMRLLQSSTGIDMLKIAAVSQSQANQRAGRAGRECPGKCFRLYTEHAFEQLPTSSIPEIQRVNISQVILQLKVCGVLNIIDFPLLSPPSVSSLRSALEELLLLGALDEKQQLTDHGRVLSRLPLDPIYGHLLIKSQDYRCVSEILTVVSMLSTDNIFIHPYKEADKQQAHQAHRRFASGDGDLPTLVNIYQGWCKSNKDPHWCRSHFISHRALMNASNIREQLIDVVESLNPESTDSSQRIVVDPKISCLPDKEPFLRCIAAGLFLQIAKQSMTINPKNRKSRVVYGGLLTGQGLAMEDDAPYRTLRGGLPVYIHPSSTLFSAKKLPQFVTFAELLMTTKRFMRNVTAVDISWLPTVAPSFIQGIFYEDKDHTSKK